MGLLDTNADFTVVTVIAFPMPWPLPQMATMFSTETSDSKQLRVVAYTDGHLEVVLDRPGSEALRRHFQMLSVPANNLVLLSVVGEQHQIRLAINDVDLLSLADADGEAFEISEHESPPPELSIGHPDALSQCKTAIDARLHRFDSKAAFVDKVHARRPKTLVEQTTDLAGAVSRLDEFITRIRRGDLHFAPAAAAEIRSLAYWPNNSPTWNPLLFRIASSTNAPLPVFAIPSTSLPLEPAAHFQVGGPSLERRNKGDELIDLEQYLAEPVATYRVGAEVRTLSAGEAIALAANTAGSAHYDDSVILDLEAMEGVVFMATSNLDRLIVAVAEAIVGLSRSLLSAASTAQP